MASTSVYTMFTSANEPRETYVDRGDPKTRPLSHIRAYERSVSYETAQRRHERKMRAEAERRRPKSARGPRRKGGRRRKGGHRRARSRGTTPRGGPASSDEAEPARRRSVGDAPLAGSGGGPAAGAGTSVAAQGEESDEEAAVVWHGGELTKFARSSGGIFKCGGGSKKGGDAKASNTRYFTVERRDKRVLARWAPAKDAPPGKWKEAELLSVSEESSSDGALGFTLVTPEGEPDIEVMAPSESARGEWIQHISFATRTNNLNRKTSSVARNA